LVLFYLTQGGREAVPAPTGRKALFAYLTTAARWGAVAAGVAVLVFLLVPRQSQQQFHLFLYFSNSGAQRAQVGFSELMDLNRTGLVEVDDELAFSVQAEDAAGNPKLDLSGEQRWRGTVLDTYQQGRWNCSAMMALSPLMLLRGSAAPSTRSAAAILPPPRIGSNGSDRPPQLANLGPEQFFLTITLEPRKAGGLFLADPVAQLGMGFVDTVVVSLADEHRTRGRFYLFQGTLLPAVYDGPREFSYRQVVAPAAEESVSEPVLTVNDIYPEFLVVQPVTELRPWSWQLLQQLAAEGQYGLTAKDAQPAPPSPDNPEKPDALPPEHWEKVARALTAYLATSGEYSYTLDLQRVDPTLDPTLDFLWNSKQGHCHRYAGGLTLMLRSLGIPARIVKGFRGANSLGDGAYLVRQNQAHSWVEVLLLRPGKEGEAEMRWLTLDPTPAGDPRQFNTFSWARLWEGSQRWAGTFWRDYIIEYNSDQQTDLWTGLRDWFTKDANGRARSPGSAAFRIVLVAGASCGAVGMAAAAGFWVVRRGRKRKQPGKKPTAPALPSYARLLALLTRHCGLQPQPAQTPREFGEAARQVLRGTSATSLSELPLRAAQVLYRVRYGGETLPDEERRELDTQIDQLEGCLQYGAPDAGVSRH
jgi:transglutaminase-like putative cysteine protease